jgi:hypothetical protein
LGAAEREGDGRRMLEIAFGVLTKSDGDIIGETLGAYQYMYFTFLERFRREPREIDDLIDGLIYIELNAYFEKKALQQ